jgi:elongator complex protein 4
LNHLQVFIILFPRYSRHSRYSYVILRVPRVNLDFFFIGSPATTNAIYSATYHGLFHVHKLPTLNSLVPSSTKLSVLSGGGGNNLGFKLRRKKFTIETFHLPPEGGINERRVVPEKNQSNKSKKKDDKSINKSGIGIPGSGCGTIPGRKVDPYDF